MSNISSIITIKKLEIMIQIKVYVVGFGTSFWDWYANENNAKTRIKDLQVNSQLQNNGIIYVGSLMVENSDDEEDITTQIENFLEENNWEESFNRVL